MDLSTHLIHELEHLKLNPEYISWIATAAIKEDLGGGDDVTSVATIPVEQRAIADYVARKSGVIAGLHIAAAVLETCGIHEYEIKVEEGEWVEPGTVILEAHGRTRELLLSERTALNFLGRLSGIATLTRQWVDEIKEFPAQIRDTRKTTPLWRELEKFAVRAGGGTNHRISLSDAALIKDNHIVAAGGVVAAFDAVRKKYPDIKVEVEVDHLEQLQEVVAAGADLVLLDNMSVEQCAAAVSIVDGRTQLEASGGITFSNARAYAATGVDFLAIGALTHSAVVLDIGLDLRMA